MARKTDAGMAPTLPAVEARAAGLAAAATGRVDTATGWMVTETAERETAEADSVQVVSEMAVVLKDIYNFR